MLAQFSPFQARGQQRHEMIPTERLSDSGIGEDQRYFVCTWRPKQNGFQRHRGPGYRRPGGRGALPRSSHPASSHVAICPALRVGKARPRALMDTGRSAARRQAR